MATGILKRVLDLITPPAPMTEEDEGRLKHLLSTVHLKAKVDVANRRTYVRPENVDTFALLCKEHDLTCDVITDAIDYLRANPKEYFIFKA